MKFITTFAALFLSVGLIHAELARTLVSDKGGWTVNSVANEKGKVVFSEMIRTYETKQEVHLRISFDGKNFHIDSSADWSEIPEMKTHATEYKIDSAENESAWKGKAKVIEEEDGMSWLRITEPNEPGTGDGIANAKKLIIYIGDVEESVVWTFDLKGSNAAYKAMVESFLTEDATAEEDPKTDSPAKPSKGASAGKLIEHEYARPGDWGVHYYTHPNGKFAYAGMIRGFDDGSMIRISTDDTHLHVDASGDWDQLKGAPKDDEGNIIVTLASDESPSDDSLKYNGKVINDEGDKWLRISHPHDEPGGLADGYRNSKTLRLKFAGSKFWSFNLKGSHAADAKVTECIEKFKK
jgi:hypothetical protein